MSQARVLTEKEIERALEAARVHQSPGAAAKAVRASKSLFRDMILRQGVEDRFREVLFGWPFDSVQDYEGRDVDGPRKVPLKVFLRMKPPKRNHGLQTQVLSQRWV